MHPVILHAQKDKKAEWHYLSLNTQTKNKYNSVIYPIMTLTFQLPHGNIGLWF
jgi:hypothetical protein